MTKYNTLNVKLSNSQLNKVKSGKKNGTEVTLTNTQVSRLPKNFFSRLSKIQLHKIGQSGEFF